MKTNKTKATFIISLFVSILFFSIILLEACSPPCYRKFDGVNHKLEKLNAKIDSLSVKVDSLKVK